MKISDPVLIDSNILVYAHNENSTFHPEAVKMVSSVIKGELKGYIASQNLLEFYCVITDKRRVPKPLSPKLALELINQYLDSPFEIIYPNINTNKIMVNLLKEKAIRDGQIFDVFLIATMLSSNIKQILTANVEDFKKFKDILVLDLKSFDKNSPGISNWPLN